jgi:hypothetical protein
MRLEISKIPPTNVVQKVNLLKEIRDSANATAVNMLTNKARVFVATVVDPILGCLENHYGNDLDQFANKWKKVAHTQFRLKMCNGKGSSCQTDQPVQRKKKEVETEDC